MANVVKKSWRAVAALVGAAATVVAMCSPAPAAVQDVNFEGHNIVFTVVQVNQTTSCPNFDLAGTYDDVTQIGVLDDLTATGCTNPIFGTTSIIPYGVFDFDVWLDSHASLLNIYNVEFELSAAGCTFGIAGSVEGSFDLSNQNFEVVTSHLQVASVPSGFLCPLLGYAQGQDVDVDGSWTNSGTPITFP